MQDTEFAEMIIKEIVEFPEDVRIEKTVDEIGTLLTISTNPSDTGKIIGKEGGTAKAIRTITRVVGMKNQVKISLKIVGSRE